MKKKIVIFGVMLALGCMGVFSGPVFAEDKGPAEIDINSQVRYPDIITKKDKKQVRHFPHSKHQNEFLKGNEEFADFKYTDDYTCSACHHTSKAGDQPGGCLKCKDVNKMLDKVGGAKKFEKIYHQNCRDGCHGAMHKAGKKTGPSKKGGGKCKGCHKKK